MLPSNIQVHHRHPMYPSCDSILCQINPVHVVKTNFCEIHFYIIPSPHIYVLVSTELFPGGVQTKIMYIFLISTTHISCSLMSSVLFNHANKKTKHKCMLLEFKITLYSIVINGKTTCSKKEHVKRQDSLTRKQCMSNIKYQLIMMLYITIWNLFFNFLMPRMIMS
jgi:hypothetical protein